MLPGGLSCPLGAARWAVVPCGCCQVGCAIHWGLPGGFCCLVLSLGCWQAGCAVLWALPGGLCCLVLSFGCCGGGCGCPPRSGRAGAGSVPAPRPQQQQQRCVSSPAAASIAAGRERARERSTPLIAVPELLTGCLAPRKEGTTPGQGGCRGCCLSPARVQHWEHWEPAQCCRTRPGWS